MTHTDIDPKKLKLLFSFFQELDNYEPEYLELCFYGNCSGFLFQYGVGGLFEFDSIDNGIERIKEYLQKYRG